MMGVPDKFINVASDLRYIYVYIYIFSIEFCVANQEMDHLAKKGARCLVSFVGDILTP